MLSKKLQGRCLEKHLESGYIQHFSEKYRQMISRRLEEHLVRPERVRTDVELYDAANMKAARLASVYGPRVIRQADIDLHQSRMKSTLDKIRNQGTEPMADGP